MQWFFIIPVFVFVMICLTIAGGNGEGAAATPSEENKSRILVSDRAHNDGVWFRYAYDTATDVCSVLISGTNGYNTPQVIECTPEVMRLFPEHTNPAQNASF